MGLWTRRPPIYETTEEMSCPGCDKSISLHCEICPHCELELL